jgi:hypothetical protein
MPIIGIPQTVTLETVEVTRSFGGASPDSFILTREIGQGWERLKGPNGVVVYSGFNLNGHWVSTQMRPELRMHWGVHGWGEIAALCARHGWGEYLSHKVLSAKEAPIG